MTNFLKVGNRKCTPSVEVKPLGVQKKMGFPVEELCT